MNRTVLVIGSVTPEQKQTVRLEALRSGCSPRIVSASVKEFFLDARQLFERYARFDTFFDGPHAVVNERDYEKFASKHLESYGDPIISIVCDEQAWDWWARSGGDYRFIENELNKLRPYTRWIAYADGRVLLARM